MHDIPVAKFSARYFIRRFTDDPWVEVTAQPSTDGPVFLLSEGQSLLVIDCWNPPVKESLTTPANG